MLKMDSSVGSKAVEFAERQPECFIVPEDEPAQPASTASAQSLWVTTKLICIGVVAVSVLSCVGIAAVRSTGLTQVSVTALDPKAEPRDHNIPFIKQKDALPDYQLVIYLSDGDQRDLGTKPNKLAADGLHWTLNEPVSVAEISGVRLYDQDKVISDAITEVQVTGDTVTADNYRCEFTTERSTTVGVQSFYSSPIGKAIAGAFCIAILLILASAFSVQ